MLKKKTPKEQRSSLVRVAVIAGSVMIVAWIAKTMVWKQGTAEFEELETRRQAMLDEVRLEAAVRAQLRVVSGKGRVFFWPRQVQQRPCGALWRGPALPAAGCDACPYKLPGLAARRRRGVRPRLRPCFANAC